MRETKRDSCSSALMPRVTGVCRLSLTETNRGSMSRGLMKGGSPVINVWDQNQFTSRRNLN